MEPKASTTSPASRMLEVLIVIGIISLALVVVLPPLDRAREPRGGRLPCPSNLRQIGQAIQIYAIKHGERLPDSLEQLIGDESLTPKALICPSTGDKPATGGTTEEVRAALRAGGGAHVSYVYLGAGLTYDGDAGVVVAYDRPGNHGDDGCNVLYADGHVEWVTMPSMRYVLDEVAAGRLPVQLYGRSTTSQPAALSH